MSSNKRLVSVSLNQVRNLTTCDGLVIHRQKIGQICVVGNVLNVNEQTTKISYLLTDYTGQPTEIVMWKNSGGQDNPDDGRMVNFPVIMEQTYAKAFGQARKDSNGNIYIVAFEIQPLANLNDLTIHLIEVVHQAKSLKRMKMNVLYNAQAGGDMAMVTNGGSQKISSTSAANAGGFSEIQNLVMDLIKKDTSDYGISLNELTESIRSVKAETIKATVDFLLNEGHIYEALDEFHFKSSD